MVLIYVGIATLHADIALCRQRLAISVVMHTRVYETIARLAVASRKLDRIRCWLSLHRQRACTSCGRCAGMNWECMNSNIFIRLKLLLFRDFLFSQIFEIRVSNFSTITEKSKESACPLCLLYSQERLWYIRKCKLNECPLFERVSGSTRCYLLFHHSS